MAVPAAACLCRFLKGTVSVRLPRALMRARLCSLGSPPTTDGLLMETRRGGGVESLHGKETAMLPLMIGMGVPVFAVIAYALIQSNPPAEAGRQ